MSALSAFHQFVTAINTHDVAALTSLMTHDHLFTDSIGTEMRGVASMEAAWRGYFEICRDYWIRPDHVLSADDLVLAAGEAGGAIDGVAWRTPAAWRAVIKD